MSVQFPGEQPVVQSPPNPAITTLTVVGANWHLQALHGPVVAGQLSASAGPTESQFPSSPDILVNPVNTVEHVGGVVP
jgi:hypothetical protein